MEDIYYFVKAVSLFWLGMIFFIFAASGNKSEKEDGFSKYFAMITLFGFLPGIQYTIAMGRSGVGNFSWGFPIISYVGFFLFFLGVVIHLTGILTLKKQWSLVVAVSDDHQLIDTGIYKFIRHPIYAAIFLELLGFSLALANWIPILIIVFPNILSFGYRICVEEKVLRKHFGEKYTNYERRTRRFIPWIF